MVHRVFKTVQAMHPTKDAYPYWQAVNRTMLDYGETVADLWRNEKLATLESIQISKEIGLAHYASERQSIMRMSHDEALKKLIEMHKIESRIDTINGVTDNLLMGIS